MPRRFNVARVILDLFLCALLGFACLFALAFTLISETQVLEKTNVKTSAEFLIMVTWDKESPADVDVWVRDPMDNVVCFKNRQNGLMHLDRDDTGKKSDTVIFGGSEVVVKENREVVSIRGIIPGEYIVNLHLYSDYNTAPVDVEVRLDKINPFATEMKKNVTLKSRGDEVTAFRFNVDDDGSVFGINNLSKRVVYK